MLYGTNHGFCRTNLLPRVVKMSFRYDSISIDDAVEELQLIPKPFVVSSFFILGHLYRWKTIAI